MNNNPELITKKEFEDFLEMQDRIIELIKLKTAELSFLCYGRLPKGEEVNFDIYESEFKPGCIFVEYVTYYCGDSDLDQFNLPFEFLYDEIYPEKYKLEFEEKKHLLKEQKEKEKQEKEIEKQEKFERWEREQLEKLKKKYG